MRFGVQIENHLGFSYEAILSVALEAERLAFDCLFICDHLQGRTEELATQPCLDPWVILGALASSTKKIRLGTLVSAVGFRYPSILAKMATTIDNVSGGRLQLSMGAGWYEPEYSSYGIPFPSTGRRMKQLSEAIQIVRTMWTTDRASFKGKNFGIKEARCYPKPVQKPSPRIWVGGTGDNKLMKIVAQLADGWNASGTNVEEYDQKLKLLESYCSAEGRSLREIERSYYASALTGKNENEFQHAFQRYYGHHKRQDETLGSFSQRVRDSSRSFIGTVDEVTEKIARFSKLGVKYLIFYFPDKEKLQLMRQFADNILPAFYES